MLHWVRLSRILSLDYVCCSMTEPEFACKCERPAVGTAFKCPYRNRIITPGLWDRCVIHQQAEAGACGEPARKPRPQPSGPGTTLKAIIAGFGSMTGMDGCGCGTLAGQMDRGGAKWCHENYETIITKLVKSRSMLTAALKQRGGIYSTAGSSIDHLPDAALRIGAAALLDQAIVESSVRNPLTLENE